MHEHLVISVRHPYAMPDIPFATGKVELRNHIRKGIPINPVDHPDRGIVVIIVGVHRVDEQITQ